MRKILSLLLVLFFAFTCFADPPVTERPVYTPGDTWVYVQKNEKRGKESKIRLEFLRMEGNNYVFLQNRKNEHVMDSKLTSLKRKEHGRYPGPVIHFPLKVGNTWIYEHLLGQYGGAESTKRSTERITTFEVIAYEEVTVPAGTFHAFKIVGTVMDSKGFGHERGTHTYWYAPDVKQIIKSNEFRIGTMELIKFHLK